MPLKRSTLFPAPSIVLGLLCLMYFITYVNRQNMATAGGDIIRDLHLTRSSRLSGAGWAIAGARAERCSSAGSSGRGPRR
jgi:hypothetical protein